MHLYAEITSESYGSFISRDFLFAGRGDKLLAVKQLFIFNKDMHFTFFSCNIYFFLQEVTDCYPVILLKLTSNEIDDISNELILLN